MPDRPTCWRGECRTGCYYPDVCDEAPRLVGVLHVDTTDPNVIVRGNGTVWVKSDPEAVPSIEPLGEGWTEVGYTTGDGIGGPPW